MASICDHAVPDRALRLAWIDAMRRLLWLLIVFGVFAHRAHAQNVNVIGGALAPNATQLSIASVTCGTSSTPFNVTGVSYLAVQIPSGGATVWFAPSGTAATTAAPSKGWVGGTDFQLSGGSLNCIVASGSQVISVWYK